MIWKLFMLQIVSGAQYAREVENQHVQSVPSLAERGTIYFQKKNGDLVSGAMQQTGYKITVNPEKVHPDRRNIIIDTLLEFVPGEREILIGQISKTNDTYEELATKVSEEIMQQIKERDIPELSFYREKWRIYPGLTLASHTLGFLGYQDHEFLGRYGVERTYDTVLSDRGKGLSVNFFAQIFGDIKEEKKTAFEGPQDVITTIEPSVQLLLEEELHNLQTTWNSESSGGIIMNPKTGAIYAMAVAPTFDLNDFSEENVSIFSNPLVEHVFEMGSIIKPLIIAMGLDMDVISAETGYYDSGSIVVGNKTISNFDKKGRGQVTINDIIAESLNTGMVFASQKIGHESMREYFRDFGFYEKTEIDLPNEGKSIVSNLNTNRDVEFATASFGQGIAFTPISVVRALSSLGNGGYLVQPHVVQSIRTPLGMQSVTPALGRQVIQSETSQEITEILVHAYDVYFEGTLSLPEYSIAAKTGTAQIPNPQGGYYTDRNLHSFFGYFPAYDPEFIVYLYTRHPKGVKFASLSLSPSFKNLAEFLLHYYEIPPDR
ncbi:MAG: penicillin-binding protein 2 [Candidatus Pacebacteria bacterium]|nr:penicillin-binding protein 2 [Candidatus Paceibacterota bacterium]